MAQISRLIYNDHLGNMRAITDTTGTAVATADYYPFGERLNITGAPGRFTYNGNELDDEYGFDLYYYGARYMDPAAGRFITPDPIRDFYNPYSYVHNNPMNLTDPTGMSAGGGSWDYGGISNRVKIYISTGTEVIRRSDPFGWISRFSSAFQSFKASLLNTESWSKEIAYKEEYNRVRNLLEELKGEVKKFYDKTSDPRWNDMLKEINTLLTGDNIYNMIKFAQRTPSGEEFTGAYSPVSNEIILSLSLLHEGYKKWLRNFGQFVKVDLILTNQDTLSGMQIPLDLSMSNLSLQVDSVSFEGGRCEHFFEQFYRVYEDQDKVFIYLIETADAELDSSPLLPGTGSIATIYLILVDQPLINRGAA